MLNRTIKTNWKRLLNSIEGNSKFIITFVSYCANCVEIVLNPVISLN